MKYLVAPDKYKGSFDALVASEIIKEAIVEVDKSAEVFQLPLADGGEGTLTALSKIFGAKIEEVEVNDLFLGRSKAE